MEEGFDDGEINNEKESLAFAARLELELGSQRGIGLGCGLDLMGHTADDGPRGG